jgi:hypothetical protein
MDSPNPVREVVRPLAPKREQLVLTEADMRRLIGAAGFLELCASRPPSAGIPSPCA